MKRKSLGRASNARSPGAGYLILAALMVVVSSPLASANPELDRQYALETVGSLRSWDNSDGLFQEYVEEAYRDYFSRQARFAQVDLSKADSILSKSKISYSKVIEDTAVLSQVATSLRVDSLIRTKVYKEGPRYRFTIDWLHAPKISVLSSETFVLDEPSGGRAFGLGDIKGTLQQALEKVIKKVPFVGHVTGRDHQSVTINIGRTSGLRRGDLLVVSTLDDVKRHPLLNAVMDWRLTQVGRMEIEEVDEGIAFCKVKEEEPGYQISRYQKIVQVIPAPRQPDVIDETKERAEQSGKPPKLGYGAIGLWAGSFSRQYSAIQSGISTAKTGSGFLSGGKAEGQLWLTRVFVVGLNVAYGFTSYSQSDLTATTSGSAATPATTFTSDLTILEYKADLAYTFFNTLDVYGPKAWARIGYGATAYDMLASADERTGSINFNSPFIGVGGELPVRDQYGALLRFDFGVLTSPQENVLRPGTASGATAVNFFVGGYYRIAPRMTIRAGADVSIQSVDFKSGEDSTTINHKNIAFTPSLLYYF
jgi:hypothetical protein